MRRKSERNKAKGTPEKKVEKPTRRTTRRRGKASPTNSPEQENAAEDNVSSTPYSEDEKDVCLQSEPGQCNDDVEKGVSSSELIKSVLGGEEEDNGSVWKVARQDASPGEIQKLKLCRQRNISEASDSSISKKKSNKWPDSGEGGTEEADSVDEQVESSQKLPICVQTDDASSSHPGQDSNEEVSDYKENLPETTSANLSDDKTNIDQLADSKENLPETTSTNLSEIPIYDDNQSSSPSASQLGGEPQRENLQDSRDNVGGLTSANLDNFQQQNENLTENSNEPICFTVTATNINLSESNEQQNEATSVEENNQDVTINESVESNKDEIVSEKNISISEEKNTEVISVHIETIDSDNLETGKNVGPEEEEEEGEIREEVEKEPSPDSDSAANVKGESDAQDTEDANSPKTNIHLKSKHHVKYGESSTSDESDNEQNSSQNKETQREESNFPNTGKSDKNRKQNKSETEENTVSVNTETELELSENNLEKEDILEINEKPEDLNVTLSASKPAKVSLKRSFSTRLSTDLETKKDENAVKKSNITESNQNKENHADNEQPDQKCATKRRRWGMTTTSDAAPAFSISTDSLKALVPGAKPLSVNEVKLTKDEDEEKEHRKNKNEVASDRKSKNDPPLKVEVIKKEVKIDNHIARRKITMVKETPRPKSPSPPEAQATNILLIRNLVRPFTLNQIKELLSRTGTIVENGFWMDRIKSKCFVEYANEDQAFETRQALHGVSWPPSNPKKLIVDYATKEDMEMARETSKDQPSNRKTEPLLSSDLWQQETWPRDDRPTVITVIREWDLGKEDGQLHVKEKERERKEFEKKKRPRSRSPTLEVHLPAPARKFKKKEEEPPTAKLLDDLFRKTKASPCIYWLPLTNEQIMVKEEMRRQHMAEHARRLEEMRRAERNRDSRRRRSPRK